MALPAALTDRLSFHVTLDDLALQDLTPVTLPRAIEDIRAAVRGVISAGGVGAGGRDTGRITWHFESACSAFAGICGPGSCCPPWPK